MLGGVRGVDLVRAGGARRARRLLRAAARRDHPGARRDALDGDPRLRDRPTRDAHRDLGRRGAGVGARRPRHRRHLALPGSRHVRWPDRDPATGQRRLGGRAAALSRPTSAAASASPTWRGRSKLTVRTARARSSPSTCSRCCWRSPRADAPRSRAAASVRHRSIDPRNRPIGGWPAAATADSFPGSNQNRSSRTASGRSRGRGSRRHRRTPRPCSLTRPARARPPSSCSNGGRGASRSPTSSGTRSSAGSTCSSTRACSSRPRSEPRRWWPRLGICPRAQGCTRWAPGRAPWRSPSIGASERAGSGTLGRSA